MSGTWFPFNYRDLAGWKSDLGIELSTTSNEAAKYLDATIAQMTLIATDPQVGGMAESMKKMMEADPELVVGQVIQMYDGADRDQFDRDPAAKQKLYDLKRKKLSDWERMHVDALIHVSKNDPISACNMWDEILTDYPGDALAAHFAFFGHLGSGRRRGLRDTMIRVTNRIDKSNRYYGNYQGKLCFGFEENGQYVQAEAAGLRALEHTPKDIWAIHSMAHIHDETQRPKEGLAFLEQREPDWVDNPGFRIHVWWHRCLHHVQLGEYEEALTQLDNVLMPWVRKSPMPFPLSDACSLLLRLHMFDDGKKLDLNDRWREMGQLYLDNAAETASHVFYDGHSMLGLAMGGQDVAAGKLLESIEEQARQFLEEKSRRFNHRRAHVVGVPTAKAAVALAKGDYDTVFTVLNPIRYEFRELFGASHAQQDVIDLLLLISAIRSGRPRHAKALLEERMAMGGEVPSECDKGPALLNQRLMTLIAQM